MYGMHVNECGRWYVCQKYGNKVDEGSKHRTHLLNTNYMDTDTDTDTDTR